MNTKICEDEKVNKEIDDLGNFLRELSEIKLKKFYNKKQVARYGIKDYEQYIEDMTNIEGDCTCLIMREIVEKFYKIKIPKCEPCTADKNFSWEMKSRLN